MFNPMSMARGLVGGMNRGIGVMQKPVDSVNNKFANTMNMLNSKSGFAQPQAAIDPLQSGTQNLQQSIAQAMNHPTIKNLLSGMFGGR